MKFLPRGTNHTLHSLTLELREIYEKYIALSKNKNEFKIENQDKENISSLLYMFLPMWKQHVFYLNKKENRLLAELRDALLTDNTK